MNYVLNAFSAALLHFVWQGFAMMAILWVALAVLRKRSADARYVACCVALAVLAATPLITTWVLYQRPLMPHAVLPAPVTTAPVVRIPASTPFLAVARSWALPVWAFGVFVFSFRMVWGCAQIALLRRMGEAADESVLSMVARLSQRMRLTRCVRVLVSTWAGGPSLMGWLRPVILLPASAISGLTPEQLEAILAHELAHIRRHDYFINWMQMLVETVLFYHPAVWWVSSRIRHERELCCDDLAVRTCEGALCYARALTTLEKMRVSAPVAAVGATDGSLLYRIQRIAGAAKEQYAPSRASVAVVLSLAVAGLVFTVNWARAQSQPTPDYLAQGDVLLKAGQNEAALAKYEQGMAAEPAKRPVYLKRCIETYMRMGRKAEAYAVNDQLLRESPTDTDGIAFGATAMIDQGRAAEAVARLLGVLQQAPENAVAHFDLGRAYEAMGDVVAARREIEEAIHLRPDFIRAKRELEELNLAWITTTTNFLKDELLFAGQLLDHLRSRPQQDAEAIRRAEYELGQIRGRLSAALETSGSVGGVIESIYLPETVRGRVRLPVKVGEMLTTEKMLDTIAAVKAVDVGLDVRFVVSPDGKIRVVVVAR